jgi:hypothetical protein
MDGRNSGHNGNFSRISGLRRISALKALRIYERALAKTHQCVRRIVDGPEHVA